MHRREFGLSSIVAALFFQVRCPSRVHSQILAGDKKDAASDVGLAGPANGPWRRLFLDATVVEEQHGLVRKFHSAEKHIGNPIIVADRPWEGKSAITGPYVYGTVLNDGQRYRMWYQILFQGNHVGYAESTDGVHWQKPALDIIQYEGQSTNFVVSEFDMEKSGGRCHNQYCRFS